MPFSPKQIEYFQSATHRWNFKTGATRSGKTFMDYFVIPKRVMNCTGNGLIVILGHTKLTVQKNIIDPMQRIWGRSLVGNISATTGAIKLFDKKCYVLAADNKVRVDAIRGSSIEYCYGDEVATWDQSIFEMLKSRLDRPNSVFDGTCNPETPTHWLKGFLDSDADLYHQIYTLYDNPFLSDEFVHNLEREYAGTVYFDRFILGKWTLAEGLIYKIFSKEKNLYDQPLGKEITERSIQYVAVDYGTANPTVFLKIIYDPEDRMVYLDDEFYYDGRKEVVQKTDQEYGDCLERFSPQSETTAVIVDPSALSFRVLLRRLNYRVKEADNDVLNGIRDVSTLLSLGKLKVNARCVSTINEFGTYAWDEKAAIQTGAERPIKQNDHCLTGDTMVQTLTGKKRLDKLLHRIGFVRCWNEKKRRPCWGLFFNARLARKNAEIYRITLEDGRQIKATGDHPVLTKRGWVRVDRLRTDDQILEVRL